MRINHITIVIAFLATACGNGNSKSDAYGNFEAVEVLVGAEAQGKVEQLNVEEGTTISKGQVVGYIDSLSLYLKREQLRAQIESATSRLNQVKAQASVQEEQKKAALHEQTRIKSLVSSNAAPSKQLDDINNQIDLLDKQITSTLVQNQTISSDVKGLQYQMAQMQDQLTKSVIRNPINGTVLEKYIETGEIATPGKTLYKIADLSILKLRVYVSGTQLPHIKLGQKVTVLIDENEKEYKTLSGSISWISQQSEFTPKIIQTKEERVNMVYAVKIDVPNDGSLKIGMPGEVKFSEK